MGIRLSRTDTSEVDNLRAWLTTVVGRVCLNMLRSREMRRDDGHIRAFVRVTRVTPELTQEGAAP